MKKVILFLLSGSLVFSACTKEKTADVKKSISQSTVSSEIKAISDTSGNQGGESLKKKVVKIKYPKPKVAKIKR